MRQRLVIVLLGLIACGGQPEPRWEPLLEIPGDSIYQLEVSLETAAGEQASVSLHRGHPTLVSMFYASCPMACPMLIEDVKGLESKLDRADRADLRVLLVSLDPERDDPSLLREVMTRHDVDADRWTLARTAPEDVREVAAVLGIDYRARSDGEMNHSSILTLVDREGRVVQRRDGLGQDDGTMIAAIMGLAGP